MTVSSRTAIAPPARNRDPVVIAAAIAAAAGPTLLAYNASPSPTFLNQALAFGLSGLFVAVSAPHASRPAWRATLPLQAALLLLALAAAGSWLLAALPASLALSALGTLAAAALLVAAGAGSGAADTTDATARPLFAAFCWGYAVAGALNLVIALVQVFLPGVADGVLVAHSGYPGRAVGNLRQPNHLSSVFMWSSIAVVALGELGRIRHRSAAAFGASLIFGVVLTASRTGLVSVLLLALWGLADRQLSRPTRRLLMAAPLVYAASWLAMAGWAALTDHAFGGSARLAETDISSSRFAIYRDTVKLIALQPWRGVGFGEFNLAWTLTPSPHRPVAFFDHSHNLLLQFAVELGLPLAAVVVALLLWALVRGLRRGWRRPDAAGVAQRSAWMVVLMIGVHSQLEYPLWYAYFLLPAAWAFGYALGAGSVESTSAATTAPPRPVSRSMLLRVGALLLMAGTFYSVYDFARVARIFSADTAGVPLAERIAEGQRSVFFAHHADYAAVTSGALAGLPEHAFNRVTHYLLDTRLMSAWARFLAARGEVDKARDLAARLHEFRKPEAAAFFAVCGAGSAAAAGSASVTASQPAFQCQPPQQPHDWREFLIDSRPASGPGDPVP